MDPKWGLISMLDRLTNGDITKNELVYKMSWIECMTLLLYYKERDEYMEKMNKAHQAASSPKRRR